MIDEAKRHGHCVTCNALLLPVAVRVAIPDSVRTAPAATWNAAFAQAYSKVFLMPSVLDDAFPPVNTKVSSATSDHPVGASSWA